MNERIETWTVGELARIAGVSVRTLHHYDAIGLLVPVRAGIGGYRIYREAEAARLQEILFLRALGMGLPDIAAALDEGDRVGRLTALRTELEGRAADLAALIETLDATLAREKGETTMAIEHLYKPFPAETQADYEAWLIDTYGADMAAAIARAREVHPEDLGPDMETLREIEGDLVSIYENGGDPAQALARHRAWVAKMWGAPCPPEAHAGLADIYLAHPDFVARYERLSPGFSQWLPARMKKAND